MTNIWFAAPTGQAGTGTGSETVGFSGTLNIDSGGRVDSAHGVLARLPGSTGTVALTADSNRDRTISFYGVNTKETLTIQYMKNGKHIPEAMEKINWILRDWRKALSVPDCPIVSCLQTRRPRSPTRGR